MARIKIIDDDSEFAGNLAIMLEKQGHSVSTRDRLEGALEELALDKPDVLILDVMFPENSAGGFDLARAIRKTSRIQDIPVILLTAINQELPMEFSTADIDSQWMPVQEFIEKPTPVSAVLEKVNALLKARR